MGGLVTPSSAQPLTTIVPLDPIWVRFKLSEPQLLQYQRMRSQSGTGNGPPPLQLLLSDGSVFRHPGRIENSLNQVDARTGTIEEQASFPNPDHILLPGQFGRVRYESEHRGNVLMVPQRAVQQNQSIQTVFVVGSGDRVEARPIQPGPRVGDDWIIERGLEPGDRVIIEGFLSVRPGVRVQPVPYRNRAK